MGVQIIGTFSGQTNGQVTTVDYTADLLAIAESIDNLNFNIGTQLITMNSFNTAQWSQAGIKIPGTPISVLAVQARALTNMSTMMASTMKTQSEIAAKLTGIQVALAQVSSQMAASVTTSQVHLAETIKNNKFQQQTTNAALVRSGIEPTVVTPASLPATIKETIDSVGPVKAAMAAAGLVEQSIGSAVAWTTTTVGNLIAESYVGSAAAEAFSTVKGWLGITKAQETQKALTTETQAVIDKATLGG
jgi:hypothetical protein